MHNLDSDNPALLLGGDDVGFSNCFERDRCPCVRSSATNRRANK